MRRGMTDMSVDGHVFRCFLFYLKISQRFASLNLKGMAAIISRCSEELQCGLYRWIEEA